MGAVVVVVVVADRFCLNKSDVFDHVVCFCFATGGLQEASRDLGHLTSRIAPRDARLSSRPRAAPLKKGASAAKAATREARLSSRLRG